MLFDSLLGSQCTTDFMDSGSNSSSPVMSPMSPSFIGSPFTPVQSYLPSPISESDNSTSSLIQDLPMFPNFGFDSTPIQQTSAVPLSDTSALLLPWDIPMIDTPSTSCTLFSSTVPAVTSTSSSTSCSSPIESDIKVKGRPGRRKKVKNSDPELVEKELVAKRMKNTIAARRCRKRRMERLQYLEEMVASLTARAEAAEAKVLALERERLSN